MNLSFEAVPQKQEQGIDRFVSFTHLFDIKIKQTLLVLLLCLCKSFQRTLSLSALSNLPGGLFCKASAKVYRISIPTKCFEDYFSKNLKINQSLDTNQSKQRQTHPYRNSGSHKNKNSTAKP